jgi:putative RecB family exonuclease
MGGSPVSTFSHSRIETFETCPKKYEFTYLLKVPRGPAGVEAFLGSRVHEALEWLYGEVRACRPPCADELVARFGQLWEGEWSDDVRIVREGRTAGDYRAIGDRALRAYHARYAPFDRDTTIGLETRIDLRLDEDHDIVGYVDRIARVSDGAWEIHDYKTGTTPATQEQADNDRQLALYEIAVREMYPDAQDVTLVWHYLACDLEVRSTRTPQQLAELREHVLHKVREIEAQASFPARTSSLCDWCDYQALCPAWRHLFETAALPQEERTLESGVVLVDEYLRLCEEVSALKARQDQLKDLIAARSRADGVERLFGTAGSIKVYRYPAVSLPDAKDPRRPAFDAEVRDLGLWERFSSLSGYQLSRALQSGDLTPEEAAKLEPYVSRGEGVKLYPSSKNGR